MSEADCEQPPRIDGKPRNCFDPDQSKREYCLCKVFAEARQRTIEAGDGWRYGVGRKA